MTQENFKYLFDALQEEFPEMGYQYDGNDTISCPVYAFRCSGIWISIINDSSDEELWSTCYDLKNANGQLFHTEDIEGQMQEVDEAVTRIIDNRINTGSVKNQIK